jgi:UDP-N-acetylmuramyl pentapeptide phosphotransferase/UDP-N-acetylglucosamine-1-phosphate transferase|tara:strand:- start:1531 stop:2550 length:1020 start_codon:yes stop_codon:yes gene_type:complete
MNIILFFFATCSALIINYIFNKNRLFLNSNGDDHQKFTLSTSVPLSGGLILILTSYYYLNLSNLIFIFFIYCIFFIGFLSDINKINSPKKRLIIQLVIIFAVVYFSSIMVSTTRLILLDRLLENKTFQIFFTIFCILVIVNGCNFMDGVNTSLLGYCLIISSVLHYLNLSGIEVSKIINFYNMIPVLSALFILNFFNKLYLGDGGSYLLGLLFSLCLINTHQINNSISPFFIACLLWYPAYENLFSILRKVKFSRSPINPDTNHLHQLIFFHLKKIFNVHNIYLNTFSGIIVNFYNLMSILIAVQFYNNTKVQVFVIMFNVSFYTLVYNKLLQKKIKKT